MFGPWLPVLLCSLCHLSCLLGNALLENIPQEILKQLQWYYQIITWLRMIPIKAGNVQQTVRPGSGGTVLSIGNSMVTVQPSSLGSVYTKPASPQKIFIKSSQLQPKSILIPQSSSPGASLAQLPSGNKFQYVRVVPSSSTPPSGKFTLAGNSSTQKTILPATISNKVVKSSQSQRLILPAGSQVAVRSAGPVSAGHNFQNMQGITLVPAQYMPQQRVPRPIAPAIHLRQGIDHHSSLAPPLHHDYSRPALGRPPNSGGQSAPSGRPKKPCNCTKSQCLKLYCECFANGEFCGGCNCANCYNNLQHEDERAKAIKACLERNPLAFHPKIGKGRTTNDRRHNKGCNCKRSGCLKNYCECYEAKILCSTLCKCVGCKNIEEGPDKTTLMHLADAAEVRKQQQTAAKSRLSSQINDIPYKHQPPPPGERLPYNFFTTEVAKATCACLVAQAEEAERTREIDVVQEKMILEEFGRCLLSVIESANSTKGLTSIKPPF